MGHISPCVNSCRNRAASAPGFFNSHSQTTRTRQPIRVSFSETSASLSTFLANFLSQNSLFVCGIEAFLQPGCRCQKQPCTKITVPYLGKTMSGVPGRSLRCSRKRKPKRCSMERTRSSGRVFFPRTFDIMSLRWEGVNLSMRRPYRRRPKATRPGSSRLEMLQQNQALHKIWIAHFCT